MAVSVVTDVHHTPADGAITIENIEFQAGEIGILGPVVRHLANLHVLGCFRDKMNTQQLTHKVRDLLALSRIVDKQWLTSRSPDQLIVHLFGSNYPRPVKWRDRRRCLLFELACCRRGWPLIEHDVVRPFFDALEAAVESGDGWARVEEVRGRVQNAVGDTTRDVEYLLHEAELPDASKRQPAPHPLHTMRALVLSIYNHPQVDFDAHHLLGALAVGGERFADELAAQAEIVRDIFGDPFRPVEFRPEWRTDTATAIARHMYDPAFVACVSPRPVLKDGRYLGHWSPGGSVRADTGHRLRGETHGPVDAWRIHLGS